MGGFAWIWYLSIFRKSCRFWDNVWKYCRVVKDTDSNVAHAHCMLDNKGYKFTPRICNTYCFSTAAQKRLNDTLYFACLVTVVRWLTNNRVAHHFVSASKFSCQYICKSNLNYFFSKRQYKSNGEVKKLWHYITRLSSTQWQCTVTEIPHTHWPQISCLLLCVLSRFYEQSVKLNRILCVFSFVWITFLILFYLPTWCTVHLFCNICITLNTSTCFEQYYAHLQEV
jgi:hypothetical protein